MGEYWLELKFTLPAFVIWIVAVVFYAVTDIFCRLKGWYK